MTSNKKDVKQSNLPLLFTSGSPTSLESMSLTQLQHFLLFLLKCEQGRTIESLAGLEQPKWWPPDVNFQDDLLERQSKKGLWSSKLRRVIQKCYTFHQSDFLLDFSRRLMLCAQQDADKIIILDNGDGTRSMKSAANGKLLVTFRSENQDYDKHLRHREKSFSTHSPMKGGCSLSSESNASDPRLPLCSDLYLCDICGADFESLQEVLAHEKRCENRQILPDVPAYQSEANKNHFFNYLKLVKSESQIGDGEDPLRANGQNPQASNVVRPRPGSHAKFLSIDISSPLGRYITDLTKSACDPIDISSLCFVERKSALRSGHYSNGSSHGTRSRREGFPVTYRGPKDRLTLKQSPHQYCFNREDRILRLQTLRTGLSPATFQLYKKVSLRQVRVNLKRETFKNFPHVTQEEVKTLLEAQRMARRPKGPARRIQKPNSADSIIPYVPKLVIGPESVYSANGFYRNFMYANLPTQQSVAPISTIQCIDLCSTDSDADDDEVILNGDEQFDFDDDENLAMAIRQVPLAASAVLGLKLEADPLRIV